MGNAGNERLTPDVKDLTSNPPQDGFAEANIAASAAFNS
jgi:hypothetical protein